MDRVRDAGWTLSLTSLSLIHKRNLKRREENKEGKEDGAGQKRTVEKLTILFKSESSCCFLSGCLVFSNSFCNCCNKVQNNLTA